MNLRPHLPRADTRLERRIQRRAVKAVVLNHVPELQAEYQKAIKEVKEEEAAETDWRAREQHST